MKQIPRLETKRLILRPFENADAADVMRLAGDRAIADTTTNIPHPYREGMAEDWMSGGSGIQPVFRYGQCQDFL
jgi:[ribosomal protein S5]-alanine N-acetyltransferase